MLCTNYLEVVKEVTSGSPTKEIIKINEKHVNLDTADILRKSSQHSSGQDNYQSDTFLEDKDSM